MPTLNQLPSQRRPFGRLVLVVSFVFGTFASVGFATVTAPTFNPAAGTYSSAQTVAISSTTSGSTIRYTTDGSAPSTRAGTIYSSPVTLSSTTTLRAVAYTSGANKSSITTAIYTISSSGGGQASAPVFTPAGGSFSGAQSVTITSVTNGASIRYTVDGSTPTETAGTLYSGPVAINATTTLKAVAYKTGLTDSAVTSAIYTIGTHSGGGLTGRIFAPYIDMSLSNNNLPQLAQVSGIKYFTLAFIVNSGSCQPQWGGIGLVSQDKTIKPLIDGLRSQGGDVIISFGGEAGTELAISCTSATALQAEYQSVIDKYNVTAVDFDIEGSALSNSTANDRRNQALAGLQAANPNLYISYTLPVGTYGLDQVSIDLLKNAKTHGVKVAVVNIMAMDYGSGTNANTMGQNAIDASNNTIAQLKTNGLTTSIGITALIGTNDTKPEIFTLNDAQMVENYAQANSQVTRVTFWEATRDKSCANNAVLWDDNDCSGIVQKPWDFSHIFETFH